VLSVKQLQTALGYENEPASGPSTKTEHGAMPWSLDVNNKQA
jgi:hypothetical protein